MHDLHHIGVAELLAEEMKELASLLNACFPPTSFEHPVNPLKKTKKNSEHEDGHCIVASVKQGAR